MAKLEAGDTMSRVTGATVKNNSVGNTAYLAGDTAAKFPKVLEVGALGVIAQSILRNGLLTRLESSRHVNELNRHSSDKSAGASR